MQTRLLSSVPLLLALSTACVSKGRYDAAVADATRARSESATERARAERRLAATRAELAQLRRHGEETEAQCRRTTSDLSNQTAAVFACAKALDDATAMNAGLRTELERLGKDVDQLLSARGALATSLDQARARLEELRRAEDAAKARALLFKDIALRLKRMIDSGELRIVLRSGRMVLVLPNDVLFDSGKTDVKPKGKEALAKVATVLSSLERRTFQVAGHTDNQAIRFSGYASNWELSTQRALEVVAFLLKSGMRPGSLSAAGYGEFDPLVPNDTPAQMAHNRRIEITLQPHIDEYVAVPDTP